MMDAFLLATLGALAAISVHSLAIAVMAAAASVTIGRRCLHTRRATWTAALLAVAGLAAWELGSAVWNLDAADATGPHTFLLPDGIVLSVSESGPTPPAWWAVAVAGVWAAGILVLSARAARRRLAVRGLVAQARPWARQAEADALALSLGMRAPRVRLSEAIATAAIAGAVRPVILLAAASEGWSAARRRQVLLHELAHLRSADPVMTWLARGLRTMLWPAPAAWIVLSRLRHAQELASDEAVLDAGEDPAIYATTLVDLAGDARVHRAALVGVSSPTIPHRVRSILSTSPRRPGRRTRATVAAVALLGATGLIMARPLVPRDRVADGATRHVTDLRTQLAAPRDGRRGRVLVDRDQAGRVRVRPAAGDQH